MKAIKLGQGKSDQVKGREKEFMFVAKSLERITFEGFQNDREGKNFLLEKVQNLIEKLPYDSTFFVHFQKKGKEYFCSFKAVSVNATFFAIVSGHSILSLEKKVDLGIKKQIIDWYNFRTEKGKKELKKFKRFVPKRFTFFNKKGEEKNTKVTSISSRLKKNKVKLKKKGEIVKKCGKKVKTK